ncbi:MAG TPA: insulinase family protein [Phycisphaerales bacterium]|nr:insulinase family protein [Phycisphaerales bacterium]
MTKMDFYQLSNGLTLVGERMNHVQSVSFHILTPGGASCLPDDCCGAASILADWLFRGAGNRDSRRLVEALDGLGIHRNTTITANHLTFNAALEAGNLEPALDLYADILLSPRLDAAQFELSRKLAVEELHSLDDDPRSKVMLLLYEQFYPDPFGRPGQGKEPELLAMTADQCARIVGQLFKPSQIIISVAGNYEFETICRRVEQLFSRPGVGQAQTVKPVIQSRPYTHYPNDGAQVHIGLMTAMPPIGAGYYYETMAAVSILSGGMSSRLFTEVREKRGLCYSVGARYHTLRDFAGISCYAGTTPDKAQQTFDVLWEQFQRLQDGITEDELQRAKVGLKSSLIMKSESTSARSAGIAGDYFLLGRVRTLEEIRQGIERLTVDSVLDFLRQHPFETFTAVTIGPKEIRV